MAKRVLHWKPHDLREPGAACGKQGVPFTGEKALVTCKACLKAPYEDTTGKGLEVRRA